MTWTAARTPRWAPPEGVGAPLAPPRGSAPAPRARMELDPPGGQKPDVLRCRVQVARPRNVELGHVRSVDLREQLERVAWVRRRPVERDALEAVDPLSAPEREVCARERDRERGEVDVGARERRPRERELVAQREQ